MNEGFIVTVLCLFLLIFWSNSQGKQDGWLGKDTPFQLKIILFAQRNPSFLMRVHGYSGSALNNDTAQVFFLFPKK